MAMPGSPRLAWYQALRAYTVLLDIMDAELRAECGVPLAWYDVLIEISNAQGQVIRMSDLADKVLLSRSWLTRRVAQLEQAGLVERRSASRDGRGIVAALTPRGSRHSPRWSARTPARSAATSPITSITKRQP